MISSYIGNHNVRSNTSIISTTVRYKNHIGSVVVDFHIGGRRCNHTIILVINQGFCLSIVRFKFIINTDISSRTIYNSYYKIIGTIIIEWSRECKFVPTLSTTQTSSINQLSIGNRFPCCRSKRFCRSMSYINSNICFV